MLGDPLLVSNLSSRHLRALDGYWNRTAHRIADGRVTFRRCNQVFELFVGTVGLHVQFDSDLFVAYGYGGYCQLNEDPALNTQFPKT